MNKEHFIFVISWLMGFFGVLVKIKPIFDFLFVFLGCVGMVVTIMHTVKKIREK